MAIAHARVGKMRLNATRLDYYSPVLFLTVNGTNRASDSSVRIEGLTIRDVLFGQPNICTMRVSGFTPSKGHEVKVGLGELDFDHTLFRGRIQQLTQVYEAQKPANVAFDLTCVSHEWLLNRRKIWHKFTETSADSIVRTLISTYTSGVTTNHVQHELAEIDEITFTAENVTDAIDRVARRIGAFWYIDEGLDLHFFTTSSLTAQPITTAAAPGLKFVLIGQDEDLSQVKTRVLVEGGGGRAATEVPVGSTTFPVDDASFYSSAGGTLAAGPQRIAHTGVVTTNGTGSKADSVVQAPSVSGIGLSTNGSASSLDTNAQYSYKFTWVTAVGETEASVATANHTTGGVGSNAIRLNPIAAPTDPAVTGMKIYRTAGGGSSYLLSDAVTFANFNVNSSPGDYVDTISDASLGAAAPSTSTAGQSQLEQSAGSTTLTVKDISQFSASGGWAVVGGSMYVRFTGRSASSGRGNLTGIPSSGFGSITAVVPADATVLNVPHLTGVSGVLYAIPAGEPVNVLETRNDTTAQTNMASFVGGDGIHEDYISDNRLSITEAQARGDAQLALVKDPIKTERYQTRDQSTRSGRTVAFTLDAPTSISGTFRIQSVTIGDFDPLNRVFPVRTVEATSQRFTFEQLLSLIRGT